jgi:putative tryptophan/tyrosine transport system substrate-binding protein
MKLTGTALLTSSVLSFLAASLAADAKPPSNIPRVGFLTTAPLSAISDRTEAFRQGLRELGYVEGNSIVIARNTAPTG